MGRPRVGASLFGGAGLGNVRTRSLRAARTVGLAPAAGRGHRKLGSRKRAIGRILARDTGGLLPSSSWPRRFARRPKRRAA